MPREFVIGIPTVDTFAKQISEEEKKNMRVL
jgi:hypothetical protein